MSTLKHIKNLHCSSLYELDGNKFQVELEGNYGLAHNSGGEIVVMKNGRDMLNINLATVMNDKAGVIFDIHVINETDAPEEGHVEIYRIKEE